jgi:non-heme chloroperoxidase
MPEDDQSKDDQTEDESRDDQTEENESDGSDENESDESKNDADEDESDDADEHDDDRNDQDLKVHVVAEAGAGRPVVLIHGWPLSGESWSAQVPALKDAGYKVVTYDRRGFGKSDPGDSYDYDALSDDLANVLSDLDLTDVTLVGFSMGGGEVARYISRHGEDRLHSVVFAAAVPPALLQSDDNPDGPLTQEAADEMRSGLEDDRDAFFEDFTTTFFSAGDDLKVSEDQRKEAVALCQQSNEEAALGCMKAFSTTDFREDLKKIDVPVLVIHGDSDGIVPFEGSGKRTHESIDGAELVLIEDAPHGLNLSHDEEFNSALLEFLEK